MSRAGGGVLALAGLAGLAALAAGGTACVGWGIDTPQPRLDLACTLRPEHPVVGAATVSCALRAAGRPVDDATVRVVGLMTHPGMAPVPVTATARGGGRYDGVLGFTMAGDWALVVTAQLPDGRRTETRVDLPGVRAASR